MAVITSVKNYIKKHKKGIFISAAIAGGSYLAGKYAATKIRDIQEKATTERLAKENLKRRFQQNQNDCVFTVISLLPTLSDQILNEMNIEAEWAKLQKSRDLEKVEKKLKEEKETATLMKEEKEITEPIVIDENKEDQEAVLKSTPNNLDASVGSLSTSVHSDDSNNMPFPPGILDKKQKQLIWETIKTKSFVRTFTSIYSITLLTLLSHIQLNLLGRFTYLWSVSVLNKEEPTIRLQQEGDRADAGYLDPQVEHMFLSMSWWLLHRGWRECAKQVQEAVDEIVSSIPLKSSLNHKEAEGLLQKLRRRIEYDEDGNPINYRNWMLPDTEEEELEVLYGTGFEKQALYNKTSTITLRKLLDETKDYIDSPDFGQVLSSCLNEVFAVFDHHAFANLLPNLEGGVSSIKEVSQAEAQIIEQGKSLTLAKLLPIISRQAHLVIAGNEYLNAFAYIKELQAFSAMIYTQFDDEIIHK
ncbi:hypothetical protein G6F46_003054 [Rhizopus delemar]|uniref:Peroxin-3 n=3 Tax=Rhizopus TaxID=4842 RepID=I1C409_RHIO9|nr:hypothetical protein RO3G_07894 [Rhizopus delemar RA 99-880]KAG1464825.1 hypothetical protein G6F55_001529 [Rhizopus delemar]KAG1549248.1 hypothetical protein G6F51_003174 [Rhizopus arrhizus]KAG1502237.1 hypothetical protein G6F54_002495 [Rhizopus delemar]KAG1515787.1 hypothetical protein G6F53_002654 [Rhizopus delemar]|eukprot:EIE83189.1 hypothetical protein RO3G_07894 [Rhizopus delemar RA 99-880]